ncbi:hypothetical protein, partial [Thiolapillus sp.]|uniref:hypothetical protein n=1 Tax=Thiolapillus sp. TaxID=2017437 RepID=UPI003AF8695B
MTRTAGAPIGCQRPSRFWGLGCPKIFHEAEDTLVGDDKTRIGLARQVFRLADHPPFTGPGFARAVA